MTISKDSSRPIRRSEIDIGPAKFVTGLYLIYGASGSGKSICAATLAEEAKINVEHRLINEPGGTWLENAAIEKLITGASTHVVIIDSISLYMLRAGAEKSGPAMKGGLTIGHVEAIQKLDNLALTSGKVVIATVNVDTCPVNTADAAATGMMIPMPAMPGVRMRDRSANSGRTFVDIRCSKEAFARAKEWLDYSKVDPSIHDQLYPEVEKNPYEGGEGTPGNNFVWIWR